MEIGVGKMFWLLVFWDLGKFPEGLVRVLVGLCWEVVTKIREIFKFLYIVMPARPRGEEGR